VSGQEAVFNLSKQGISVIKKRLEQLKIAFMIFIPVMKKQAK
jgi:hypothetical protein